MLGHPLWSPSGTWLLTWTNSPQQVFSVNTASGQTAVVVAPHEQLVLKSLAWSSSRDELCYVLDDLKPKGSLRGWGKRTLRIATANGAVLRQVDIPVGFESTGLEWTRQGQIVVVDTQRSTELNINAPPRHGPSLVRVYSENLEREREFALPFTVRDVKVHPELEHALVALAGDRYEGNIISIDLNSGETQQITAFGGVAYGSGRWKCVGPNKIYFTSQGSGKYNSGGVYRYDTTAREVHAVVSGTDFEGGVSSFDVSGDKAAFTVRNHLYLIDLEKLSTTAQEIGKKCYLPSFSPDGEALALIRNNKLVVMNLRNGEEAVWSIPK